MAHDEHGRKVTGDQLPKSFSVGMGGTGVLELTPEEKEESDKLRLEREAESKRIANETRDHLNRVSTQKVTRKLVPYGTRILVKRRKVEDKSSHIILPDEVKNLPTDIADVVEVPEQSLVDAELLKSAGDIVSGLGKAARNGDASAVDSLIKFREYLQVMTIKKGDVLLMARYGGTDFLIQETNSMLCVCEATGIYALVVEKVVNPVVQPANKIAEDRK